MHTVKTIAEDNGKTVRTVRNWIKKAIKKYPMLAWPRSKGVAAKYDDGLVEKILEFAPTSSKNLITEEDRADVIQGEIVEITSNRSSSLKLQFQEVLPVTTFTNLNDARDERKQLEAMSALALENANRTVINATNAMIDRSLSSIATNIKTLETNVNLHAQKKYIEMSKEIFEE